ncbi:hypothetical protein ACOMHN_002899 [Nucella lapillus]
MSADTFYLNMQQQSASSKTSGSTATTQQKAWSSHHHSAEVSSKYWSYKTTEIRLGPGSDGVLDSVSSAPSVAPSASSSPTMLPSSFGPSSSTLSSATPAGEREGVNGEVKLPKNAVELIAWAITECNTTTPTLTHIASHIQAHVATYRDEELSVLVKMVQHHLNKNNPTYFLPVLSSAGHRSHNPNLARWAINLQVVSVGNDGSLIRRRHRSHAYQGNNRRSYLPSSTPPSAASPFAIPSSSFPTLMMTPPDGAGGGSGHNPQFASFSGSACSYFSPSGPAMMGPPPPSNPTMAGQIPSTLGGPLPFPLFDSTSPAGSLTHGHQPSPLGTGMYGVPVSAGMGMGMAGALSTAPSQAGMTYQLPLI